jgi:DNA-binding response OmpR family regulator
MIQRTLPHPPEAKSEKGVRTILIVDSDLGFAFWLGQALHDAGYEALPAKGVPEATALIGELKTEIDLLIINPSLTGAPNFANALRHFRGDLKVLAMLGEKDREAGQIPNLDATIRKPLQVNLNVRALWLGIINQLLIRDDGAA